MLNSSSLKNLSRVCLVSYVIELKILAKKLNTQSSHGANIDLIGIID